MAIGINLDGIDSDDGRGLLPPEESKVDKNKKEKKSKKEKEPAGERKSLKDRIKKNTTIKDSAILSTSKFFNVKDMIDVGVPMVNVALSGKLNGGLTPGLTMWAGQSKHFKTAFSLLMAKAYMLKYPDAIMLFYDSEFGTPKDYFNAFGIDMDRVIHTPLMDIEQLKFDIMQQLQDVYRGDKLIILVDSIGNLASKKEVDDALEGNSAADMTRAKQIKSLFRMVTPHLNLKDIPMVVVNHTYKTQEKFSKDVVSGGTGPYYSADNIFIIGRQQDKEGTEIIGYEFIINVEKSRFVREKSKIPISVTFDEGIHKYSGLFEVARESGHVDSPSSGWYCKVNKVTGEIGPNMRKDDLATADFWDSILADKEFQEFIVRKYSIAYGSILENDSKPNVLEKEYEED
ncbi:recombinase RecA [Candidatus Dojkabacteria bacterium]|jgi:RecA/RadA recombinase|nr:recombinase RecA [Candidatus Dojkabacteria bacterium]